MARIDNDAYYTPSWMVRELLDRVRITGMVLESCAGDGAIADALDGDERVVKRNDLFVTGGLRYDATSNHLYYATRPDWVVTNPPFSLAANILATTLKHVKRVALLLRLSFLEPTKNREALLHRHPPSGIIILPRWSFTGSGSDSCTCAWMLWGLPMSPAIQVTTRLRRDTAQRERNE